LVHGVGRPRLGLGWLKTLQFPLAPLPEQHRIVEAIESYFTRLDDAVATLERVQRNLKRYRASVLKAAVEGRLVPTEADLARAGGRDYEPASALLERILAERRRRWHEAGGRGSYQEPLSPNASNLRELPAGWCWATVDQLAHEVRYGTSAKTQEEQEEGVPVVRMGNIVDGFLDLTELKYLPASHDEFPDLLLQPGDVLFNRTNSAELVGKTAVFHGQREPCSFASYLIRVRVLQGAHPEFVSHYINSMAGRAWIASVVSQQVGQANVNGTKLRACTIPLPPTNEQHRIVGEVDRLFSVASATAGAASADHRRCQRLRQSILKWAFEGRLANQDPSDEPASALLERIRSQTSARRESASDTHDVSRRRRGRRSPVRTGQKP
jgi:type I restriction enzyme S subunit